MNIRLKLFGIVVGSAILPALVIAVFSCYKISGYLETRQGAAMQEESKTAGTFISSFIEQRYRDLRLLKSNPTIIFARSIF